MPEGCQGPVLSADKRMPGFEICKPFSEGLALVMNSKTRSYGYIDREGSLVIPDSFADAQPFSEGLAAVLPDQWGKYGYIDKTGRTAIPPAFDAAFPFSAGLAAVRINGKYGFADKTGALQIPPQFDRASAFSEGLAQIVSEGLAGFVDTSGRIVIEPGYFKTSRFQDGLAAACSRSKCGFVDRGGKERIAFTYDDAGGFSQGFAPVRKGSLWGYIDTSGKWLVEPEFQEAHEFREGVALVGKRVTNPPDRGYGGYSGTTTVCGFLDRTGKFLIEPSIPRAASFSGGLARIQVPAGGLCSDCYDVSYLRKDGSLLPRYRFGGSFQGGAAVVKGGASGEHGFLIDESGRGLIEFDGARFEEPEARAASNLRVLYGYVGRDGKTMISHRHSHAEPFSDGLALVRARDGRKASRSYFIDTAGTLRLELPVGVSYAEPFSDGLAMLVFSEKTTRRYAYMDKTGAVQIEGPFTEARPFSGGLAAVKTTSQLGRNDWGYINRKGEFAVQPGYNHAGPFIGGLATVSFIKGTYLFGAVVGQDGKLVAESFYPLDSRVDQRDILRQYAGSEVSRELVPIHTKQGFAYANRNGAIAIGSGRFAKGEEFSEGLAAVMLASAEGRGPWGYINAAGQIVIDARFREAHIFSEGLALVRDESERYGFIDPRGEWAIPPSFYEEAHTFSDGRALVKLNGSFGYIDRQGNLAIRPKYVRAASFTEGLAATGLGQ